MPITYTKESGRKLANMAKNDSLYHIIPIRNSKWYFVQHGKLDPEKIFKSKEEAVKYAKEKIKKESLNLSNEKDTKLKSPIKNVYIHDKYGTILEEIN